MKHSIIEDDVALAVQELQKARIKPYIQLSGEKRIAYCSFEEKICSRPQAHSALYHEAS